MGHIIAYLRDFGDRLVDEQQFIRGGEGDEVGVVQVQSVAGAAAPHATVARGVIEEDAHGLGGGEEVPAAVPPQRLLAADQPQLRRVDRGGRLECLV